MEAPQAEAVGIRQARAELSNLMDRVTDGAAVVICRRSTPLAALISPSEYERFLELERRDEGLRAVLKGRGLGVNPWTTPKILELITRLGDLT